MGRFLAASRGVFVVLVAGWAACRGERTETQDEGNAATRAFADVSDSEGRKVGRATFEAIDGGVKMTLTAEGLPPGPHGLHVHEHGSCVPPEFESAGAHFNPTHREHGLQNPEGAHMGDLPNLVVAPDGRATFEYVLAGVTLEVDSHGSLLHRGGTALVIHAGPDDLQTDPAGRSGARIACGVIGRSPS